VTDISVDRVRELVEARFASTDEALPEMPTFSFKVGFPLEELTERQKRSVYDAVIGFANQLKKQREPGTLRWRVKPKITTEAYLDPHLKCRSLFFRVGVDK